MRGSRQFCQRGSNCDNIFSFFLVDEERKNPNTTLSGRSSARQRNAIEMAFRWRAYNDPTSNSGLVAFYDFSGDPDQFC